MSTDELRIDAQTTIAAKKHHLVMRQEKTPLSAVTALANMQKAPRTVLNVVTSEHQVTLIGQIRHEKVYDPVATALRYLRYGVDGISLYTDNKIYSKGLDDLSFITQGINSPILVQDYTVNEYHVTEARAAGASALVLYASLLARDELRKVVSLTSRWRMTGIVQVNTEEEILYAESLSPHVIGVGLDHDFVAGRDLKKLERLRPYVAFNTRFMPLGCIRKIADVKAVLDIGVDAIIVDETLLKNEATNRRLFELLRRFDE